MYIILNYLQQFVLRCSDLTKKYKLCFDFYNCMASNQMYDYVVNIIKLLFLSLNQSSISSRVIKINIIYGSNNSLFCII